MSDMGRIAVWIVVAFMLTSVAGPDISFAKEKKLTPEELITRNLQSIGSPDLLAKIQSRAFIGLTKVRFIQGAFGELSGQGQFGSEENKLGVILKFSGQDYRGEHFAYDGKDVTVGRYLPGKISLLADFINRYDGIMKEGMLGGALSIGWIFRDYKKIESRLKYKKAKLEGRQVHALEYHPKGAMGDFKIMFFFDPETFHHIRTEYKLNISSVIGGGAAVSIGIERSDSHYLLSEEFADFREIDGMTLPQNYTIGFSSEGGTRTFLAYWTFEAERWIHNTQIDENIFKALVY